MTLCDVCVRLFSCKPDYCIIVSPLDKPRRFWGKQLLICLNKFKKKKVSDERAGEFNIFPFRKTLSNTVDFDTTQVMRY